MSLITVAANLGGNVRVGLEDSLYLRRGRLAASNAEQVRQIRTILENLSASHLDELRHGRMLLAQLLDVSGNRAGVGQDRHLLIDLLHGLLSEFDLLLGRDAVFAGLQFDACLGARRGEEHKNSQQYSNGTFAATGQNS